MHLCRHFATQHALSHIPLRRLELFADWKRIVGGGGVLLHTSTDGKHLDFETVIPAAYEIIAPDVSTVIVCSTASGTKERSAFFRRGIYAFELTPPDGLFGAVCRAHHFRLIEWQARLTAELNC
jgi:hypothetical protein